MIQSFIKGLGAYVPNRVVTNFDLEKMMETSDEWITQRSGIKERRWVTPEENNTDLAYQASMIALEDAGLKNTDIDLIIFGTINPDYCFPGNGVFLQEKLGIPGVPALDIRQQCSAFVYGLSIADQYIRAGSAKNVLVVGSEIHSRGLDKSTRGRDVTVLFGDGAGAVIVSAIDVQDSKKDPHILSTHLHADGRGAKFLWTPAPGAALDPEDRLTTEMMEKGLHYPHMEGKRVFVEAVTRMCEVLLEALQKNQLSISEIDLFFFHQANLRINTAVAEHLKIPKEKVFNTIEKFGNTTAATIPLGMYEAKKAGVLKRGQLIATVAFGSGYTWAASIIKY